MMRILVNTLVNLSFKRQRYLLQSVECKTILWRSYNRSFRPTMRELYKRRLEIGPEPERPRSVWANWNYGAEVFAFGKRLGEDFNEESLKTAFVDRSYIEQEHARRQELDVGDESVALSLDDNSDLATSGKNLSSTYIKSYLHTIFPKLPDEGILALHDHLLAIENLAYVSANLGTKDLILCRDLKPSEQELAQTLMAVIGALAKDSGTERAQLFVQDFIITQLHGKELNDIIEWENPMGVLEDLLKVEKRAEPEPRLLWQTGSETVMAAYVVGIYSDQTLIGQSPGETVSIAEDMAARDSLRNICGLADNLAALKFGKKGHELEIK